MHLMASRLRRMPLFSRFLRHAGGFSGTILTPNPQGSITEKTQLYKLVVFAGKMSSEGPPDYGMPIPAMFLSDGEERTFQYDNSLPSLPVPPLDETLAKYLESGVLYKCLSLSHIGPHESHVLSAYHYYCACVRHREKLNNGSSSLATGFRINFFIIFVKEIT